MGHMKVIFLFSISALICSAVLCQERPPGPVEIVDEPHHKLILKNQSVQVFRLRLLANEVTLPHRHRRFYAFISMDPAIIGNEVQGRQPVLTELKPAEVHTSRGGFTVAERTILPSLLRSWSSNR